MVGVGVGVSVTKIVGVGVLVGVGVGVLVGVGSGVYRGISDIKGVVMIFFLDHHPRLECDLSKNYHFLFL